MKYLNYFEKYYDSDKELLSILYEMKLCIDYNKDYNKSNFMADVNRYIIRNTNLCLKIRRFVDDNYTMKLSSYNNKTPNLQFTNSHAKVLYEISLLMNIYIPLATHFIYVHSIKTSVQDFMLKLFDMCCTKYEEERGIYIYDKLKSMWKLLTGNTEYNFVPTENIPDEEKVYHPYYLLSLGIIVNNLEIQCAKQED